MQIVITSKKPVLTEYGRFPMGHTVNVPLPLAQFLIARGDAVALETKQASERPSQAAGQVEPSQSLPVAQASTDQTATKSENGGKRRGRPLKDQS